MPTSRREILDEARARGRRAENVAEWYFRLNGFFSIPSFVVHLDGSHARTNAKGDRVPARTEADIIGVRLAHSMEIVDGRNMEDDPLLINRSVVNNTPRPMFVLVEVKASDCDMNGPWTDSTARNMQRVIRRVGLANNEITIDEIAQGLYQEARWVGKAWVVQYVCVGATPSQTLQTDHAGLLQITWSDIGRFLFRRFAAFPEKLPDGLVHEQWPDFGRRYGKWFARRRSILTETISAQVVANYVASGTGLD